jgi:type II secretory pathway component PulK
VLIIVVLLSLAAFQFSELMTSEYRAASSAIRATQSLGLAESGIHYAMGVLSNPDAYSAILSSNPYDNESAFQRILVHSDSSPQRRGSFSIIAAIPPGTESGSRTFRYGVTDESGKININSLVQLDPTGQIAHDVLMKLPNVTEEIADAIIDWIDADDNPRPAGAEGSTYAAMSPPYQCKNGPLDTIEELLQVRDVTPQLLFGTDRNRNGTQDSGEDDGNGFDPGWSAYLTVYSRERNVDSTGNPKTNLNDSDLKTLLQKLTEIGGSDLANYIILARSVAPTAVAAGGRMPSTTANSSQQIQEKVNSIVAGESGQRPRSLASRYELVNSSVSFTTGSGRNQRTVTVASPLNDPAKLRQLLPVLLNQTTTQRNTELPARVNVNTAPMEVLAALPGMTDADVQAIIQHRPSYANGGGTDATYETVAWLLTEANLPVDKLRTLERYITARTQVYRIQSIGFFENGGPIARVEAVVDTNNSRPRILLWRELTELGKGFNPYEE